MARGLAAAVAFATPADHFCDGGANNDCTLKDLPFPVGVNCGAAAGPSHKAKIELGQLEVFLGLNRAFAEGLLLP